MLEKESVIYWLDIMNGICCLVCYRFLVYFIMCMLSLSKFIVIIKKPIVISIEHKCRFESGKK